MNPCRRNYFSAFVFFLALAAPVAEAGTEALAYGVAVGPDGALYFTSDSDTNGLFRLRRK